MCDLVLNDDNKSQLEQQQQQQPHQNLAIENLKTFAPVHRTEPIDETFS